MKIKWESWEKREKIEKEGEGINWEQEEWKSEERGSLSKNKEKLTEKVDSERS